MKKNFLFSFFLLTLTISTLTTRNASAFKKFLCSCNCQASIQVEEQKKDQNSQITLGLINALEQKSINKKQALLLLEEMISQYEKHTHKYDLTNEFKKTLEVLLTNKNWAGIAFLTQNQNITILCHSFNALIKIIKKTVKNANDLHIVHECIEQGVISQEAYSKILFNVIKQYLKKKSTNETKASLTNITIFGAKNMPKDQLEKFFSRIAKNKQISALFLEKNGSLSNTISTVRNDKKTIKKLFYAIKNAHFKQKTGTIIINVLINTMDTLITQEGDNGTCIEILAQALNNCGFTKTIYQACDKNIKNKTIKNIQIIQSKFQEAQKK